uniref:BED-type domain-containing protein n=1 Tax=Cyprinus carpio TaxID=7962 RepID=A0A8C2E9F5_CYPCA
IVNRWGKMEASTTASSFSEEGSQQQKASFDGWRFSNYFEYVQRKENNLTVKCTLCPGRKLLSTACNSTSNLKKHLQRQHGHIKLVAKRQSDMNEQPHKQQKLSFEHKVLPTSKSEINKLVASYVVEEMLPLSTVESLSFRKILCKIPIAGTDQPFSDRKTFAMYLDKCYAMMESELKKTFESTEYVSTTADIWTCHNKSYIGMTAHWIDPSNFHREKAALACKRIKGRHTYDIVATEIEQVHSSYGLSEKVTATVTDNGSNFVKAFREYEPKPAAAAAASDSEDEGSGEDEEVSFTDVQEVFSTEQEDPGHFTLPPHLRCASHTLNLISTVDIEKWLTVTNKTIYRSATAKCSALWTKASRSTVAAELVESLCGKKLMVPTVTRWNSFHNAVARITEISRPQLTTLCSQLGVRAFSEREYKFLVEYCTVTKPLTKALDRLQEKYLILEISFLQAIKTRFASVLDSREGLLAAVTLPKFKMRWLREETRREALKNLLITECRASPLAAPHNEEHEVRPPQISPASSSSEDDFFVFEEEQDSGSFGPDREVMEYLKSGSEMGVLDNFPRIKNLSLKYNTAPASSAPVERLFSLGSLVLTPRRNRLGDKRFERLLLMRYNHYFDK